MSEDGPEDIPMGLWPKVRAIPEASETLLELSSRFRLAVATNATVSGRDMIERALARVSMLQFISEIFCFREVGARKDSPQFWSAVMSILRANPRDLAMVGDSLEQDVVAPRREGIFSVWFNQDNRQRADPQGLPTIHRLGDLVPIVTSEV
jgi:putative hydrolase of the HAD superfamily